MQLACPNCHTGFRVDPSALGAGGRTVRCTRCRTTWFARAADAVSLPMLADAMAGGGDGGMAPGAPPASMLPQVVPWNDTVMVEVNSSPSIAPGLTDTIDASATTVSRSVRGVEALPPSLRPRRAGKKEGPKRTIAIALMVAAILFAAVNYRTVLVRYVPELAGVFAAVGLPVNLRGLEFKTIKTSQETQDGVPVLIIEGEVVNVMRQPVEVPRLRLAVVNAEDRELYAWTALLPRSVLPEGESLPFRSRLASPPPDAKKVVVRFLNRADLTSGLR